MRSEPARFPLPLLLLMLFGFDDEEIRFRSPNAASRSLPLLEPFVVPDVDGLTGASLGVDAGRRACGLEDEEGPSRARGLKPTSSVER